MNEQLVVALILGACTIVGAIVGAHFTSRATLSASKREQTAKQENVELLAYQRARETYESMLDEVRQSATDARDQAAEANRQASEANRRAATTHAEVGVLRRAVRRYEARIRQLEDTLRTHRIPVPAWTSTPNLDLIADEVTDPDTES
jgi:chromosome segregation ATPase